MEHRRKARFHFQWMLAWFWVSVLIMAWSGGCNRTRALPDGVGSGGSGGRVETERESSRTRSVTVLLTGFGPFGSVKKNASWQAVKNLDGKVIDGVHIRSLRLPVLWSVPLPVLRKMARELEPRAIFSFGQGHPGKVAFEKVADNSRRSYPDNDGKHPPGPSIVKGGPAQLTSTFPIDSVMSAYCGPKVPIRHSAEAGGYLCEECLYSLETVRAEVPWEMDVAFFHF
ncbi:MAG: pyroglutamyl-peptidase I, partial [Planctomycetota bacterium]